MLFIISNVLEFFETIFTLDFPYLFTSCCVFISILSREMFKSSILSIPFTDDLYTFKDDLEDNLYPWKMTSIDENCADKTQ